MIAIVTGLREELTPLLRRARIERVERVGRRRFHVGTLAGTPVALMAGGDGLENAEGSVSDLLRRLDASLLVGVGIAGGIVPAFKSGDLIVATEVLAPDGSAVACDPLAVERMTLADPRVRRATIRSVERIAGSVAAKHELARKVPVAHAIDTESAGWSRAASEFGIPFLVVRAIFDGVEDEVPELVSEAGTADGSIDRGAVLRRALRHPTSIPGLMRMRAQLRACSEALADLVARSVAALETCPIDAAALGRLDELLTETSRTFALCIPLLRDATRLQVTIAYLLFRIADSFEDASHWSVADRLAALDAFCTLLSNPDTAEGRRLASAWYAKGPSTHAGCMKLIADVPVVIDAFAKLPLRVNEVIRDHVIRSARGMARFVAMTDHDRLQLADMQQLQAYCYAVAGIVGEMLTELFLLRAPNLCGKASFLRAHAPTFGEGLQLVNILKDSVSDASEGRIYIPPGVDRADVAAIARADLETATEYTLALQSDGAPDGIVAFAALPIALAQATLDRLEESGPGAKIGRPEVFRIASEVNRLVARGEPPLSRRAQSPSGPARISNARGRRGGDRREVIPVHTRPN